jgi:hypothetical protein
MMIRPLGLILALAATLGACASAPSEPPAAVAPLGPPVPIANCYEHGIDCEHDIFVPQRIICPPFSSPYRRADFPGGKVRGWDIPASAIVCMHDKGMRRHERLDAIVLKPEPIEPCSWVGVVYPLTRPVGDDYQVQIGCDAARSVGFRMRVSPDALMSQEAIGLSGPAIK